MPVKLPKTNLPQLLTWLEQHLPHSFKLYGELKSHLKGQFPDLDFFVDRWPDPQAVVAEVDPEGEQLGCKGFLQNVVQAVYGVNDEALRNLLKDPSIVDWNMKTRFPCLPDSLWPVVQRVADEMKRSAESKTAYLLKATPQDLKPIPVPEGMKFKSISSAEIQIIDSTRKFTTEGSETYIQYCVQHFPSAFLVTDNGQHVGHMVGTSYGTMGMLYVNPEFRRKGYAKVIVSQLAQKYFDRGEDAYVIVEEVNPVSLSLHQSLAFRVVPGLTVVWMRCVPKGCKQLSKQCCV